MQDSYIPVTDPGLDVWFGNFSSVIADHGAAYGVLSTEAAAIAAEFAGWHDAYVAATEPSTRTRPSVAAKDSARAAVIAFIRPIAMRIKSDRGITNEQKIVIGVRPPNNGRSPVLSPSSHPLLDVIGATFGVHTLRFSDSNTPASRRKPFGVTALQLFRSVAPTPGADPAQSSFVAQVTRQPFASGFGSGDNGKFATYFARWVTGRGLVGPWSPPVTYTIVS